MRAGDGSGAVFAHELLACDARNVSQAKDRRDACSDTANS